MGKKKQKVVLPPELPPDVPEDEVEVSDEDLDFVAENIQHVGFLNTLDTQSITRHVTRVADVKEDALESLYEQRLRKKSLLKEKDDNVLEVDPVDALPVKTPDGKIVFRTVPKARKVADVGEATSDNEDNVADESLVRLTKAEKRAKLKKLRKEAKKQGREVTEIEEVNESSQAQADVLEEVKKDLTAEEVNESKKFRLAEIGTALLTDPEANIKSLSEMLQISKSEDRAIVALGLKSLLAVFKDIIPGYRIRLPTEKEQAMVVSKAVKKMRFYESTLLSVYKAYLLKLIYLGEKPAFQRVAIRCICNLLEAVPHFNFRERLLAIVVKNISSADDVVRKLCCAAIKSVFTNEGKHGGEVTVEAVRSIAALVKAHDCQLHPDSIEVFMSLVFDEDLGRAQKATVDKRTKSKKFKKRKNQEEQPSQLPNNDKKKARKEMISRTQEEVDADYKAASFAQDIAERRRMQTETLSAIFEIYFRILKHTFQTRTDASSVASSGGHPLLVSCLNGIGKFSHLVDLDFMADLMSYLGKLARGSSDVNGSPESSLGGCLTVSERLQCCIVAFKVMKSNLDALNIDLQDFYAQLYQLILEYRPGRDKGEVLAEALKVMLCDDRQHDMQRAAAFIKRLATFSLCFGAAESMAALVTLKHLLQKNVKCRNLLENDAGGGSVSGPVAKYHPYASDPNLSGALASVLWELNLLSKHYHPSVSTMALSIANLCNTTNQVYHTNVSPQQAFTELSLEKESFTTNSNINKSGNKRKRANVQQAVPTVADADIASQTDNEVEVRKKLSEHFLLLRDISENGRLKSELDRTTMSLQLYQQYKKQKKKQR